MLWFLALMVSATPPVVVLEPVADSLSVEERVALETAIASSLARSGVAGVVSQTELVSLVDAAARRQSVGCDDAACAAEIAGALGAPRAVVSRVVHFGDSWLMTTSLVDVREARVLARGEASADTRTALFARVGDATASIARALGHTGVSSVAWPAGMIGAAVVLGSAGVAWDVAAPSSKNGAVDAVDAIGPALYVAAAVCAAGALFNPFAPSGD